MGYMEAGRNDPDLNLARFAIRLHDGETPSVESLSTIRSAVFVTRRVSIVGSKERSCTLYLEGDFIVCGGHHAALPLHDMDRNVSHIRLDPPQSTPYRTTN